MGIAPKTYPQLIWAGKHVAHSNSFNVFFAFHALSDLLNTAFAADVMVFMTATGKQKKIFMREN